MLISTADSCTELEFYNAIDNSFGDFAAPAYDTVRKAGLIA